MLMATEGAVHQPVLVLDVEGKFVDHGVHFIQRVDQVIANQRLSIKHGGSSTDIEVWLQHSRDCLVSLRYTNPRPGM